MQAAQTCGGEGGGKDGETVEVATAEEEKAVDAKGEGGGSVQTSSLSKPPEAVSASSSSERLALMRSGIHACSGSERRVEWTDGMSWPDAAQGGE